MRQFDIGRLRDGGRLVVVLQHGHVEAMGSCVVAPLVPRERSSVIARLRPEIIFEGAPYILEIDRLAGIDRRELAAILGTVASRQDAIKSALDLLFLGF